MDTLLAVLLALGIFIVIPVIIGFIWVGVVSGLFQVIGDRLRRRAATLWTKPARTAKEPVAGRIT